MKEQIHYPFYQNLFPTLKRDKPKAKIIIFLTLLEKGQWRNRRRSHMEVYLAKAACELGYDRERFVRTPKLRYIPDIYAGIDEAYRHFDVFRFQKQKLGFSVSATLAFEEPALFYKSVPAPIRQSLESWAQLLSVDDILCEAARKSDEDDRREEISLEDWEKWENI